MADRSNGENAQSADVNFQEPDPKQELFLPVHGHVELYSEEVAIIDHPAYQRLRRVKQLGLAHMVFPGATHTRFEHSVGAVHVAQLIVNHVNSNHGTSNDTYQWQTMCINDATARFIRLAALLHDVGHLPLGHTLEDELNHLRSHDGPERLERVANIPYPNHELRESLILAPTRPSSPKGGWTLRALVNYSYHRHAEALGLADRPAFEILSHIVCKPPKAGKKREEWDEDAEKLSPLIPLSMCQDIVGDTICADFLDYIYRDWYHLGKPLYCDKRLYQYMEVRKLVRPGADDEAPKFVVNVGASERIRHDALTDILELLNARYKLAETVLFHRTKLALTGLLDRALLEIGDLYNQAGIEDAKFKDNAEALLLDASDDGIPGVLRKLAAGGDTLTKQRIEDAIQKETAAVQEATTLGSQKLLVPGKIRSKLAAQRELAVLLIEKLRDREVYSLAFKLRMADFTGPHTPTNVGVRKLLDVYSSPRNRLDYLRKMEALCGFAPGTLIMNCPPDAAMNAKIAKVNLYIEDEVTRFDEYEERGQPNLTCGALLAQIKRFYELWAASVYVESRIWAGLSEGERKNLRSVLREFLYPMEAGKDPKIARAQMQPSLDVLRKRASRAGSLHPIEKAYEGTSFPSGLPFDNPVGN